MSYRTLGNISDETSSNHPHYWKITEKINKKNIKLSNKQTELEGRPWQPSIYRVPGHLRKLNEDAYTPCHVSIGPFHHGDHKYRVVEEHKFAYTMALIGKKKCNRCSVELKVPQYIEKVASLEANARLSYAEEIELSKEEFVEMLLIDGCFIVEFLCRKIRKLVSLDEEPTKDIYPEMFSFIERNYRTWDPANDFIFQSTRTSFEVRRDLTLLENQLPYFVLEEIYKFTFYEEQGMPDFREIVYCALRTSIPNTKHILSKNDLEQSIRQPEVAAHLVSFLKICCGPSQERANSVQNGEGSNSVTQREHRCPIRKEFPCLCNMETHDARIGTATKLAEAGVEFRPAKTGHTQSQESSLCYPLLEIAFKNGVLKIPELIMWHHTETFFRNAMAYELYNHTANSACTSISDYLCFMDDLINTKDDVALLVKSGIIQNWLESDEAVANIFNSITKNILADYASYSYVCKDMNRFCQTTNRRKIKAVIKRDFFNEPKAIMYFITGVLIQTAAAIVQTVVSFRSTK